MTITSRFSAFLIAAGFVAIAAAPLAAQPGSPVAMPAAHDSGYLMFRSADGAFAYWLDGRVQIDAAFYRGGKNALGSGTEVRRARLGWKATLYKDWHGEIDVDFAENAVEMKDMCLGYQGFKNSIIKVGNFKEPFSLETLTSSKYITFIERSYIDNLSPDRHIGLSYSRWGEHFYATGGVFGEVAGTPDASARGEAYAFTGRAVYVPVNKPGRLLHIGGALSRRTPDAATGADTNTMRFRARPETDVSKTRFITTGKVRSVDHTSYYNAEFAGVYGPFTLQSEYSKVVLHKLVDSLTAPEFGGYYVSASFFLTGETRPYSTEDAEFDRVIPKSSRGAWEIAARVSSLDLNDTRSDVNILGGKGTNFTLGLNWHINANFKWMLDYTRVSNDDNAKPDLTLGTPVAGDKFNIFATRFSLAF